jgi:ribosome-associated heat shock protein Hsp15|tara:strand:- start:68 stop:445 length:378 start_codon:yes stop_codon:yes gene_type:complete
VIGVRLDKWLWAARLFKTRGKAKEAIDGGKVHVNGQRGKPSKDVQINNELVISQGWDKKTVIVKNVTDKRGGAPAAQLLYTETEESIKNRNLQSIQRKAAGALISRGPPSKRDRRLIRKFRDQNL